jgi:hypothetical protein
MLPPARTLEMDRRSVVRQDAVRDRGLESSADQVGETVGDHHASIK